MSAFSFGILLDQSNKGILKNEALPLLVLTPQGEKHASAGTLPSDEIVDEIEYYIDPVLGVTNETTSTHIISKIESQEGIDNFEEILALTDGIMVARGDMGVEIPMEQVPVVQKHFIKRCNQVGKPVVTATQMLQALTVLSNKGVMIKPYIVDKIVDSEGNVILKNERIEEESCRTYIENAYVEHWHSSWRYVPSFACPPAAVFGNGFGREILKIL